MNYRRRMKMSQNNGWTPERLAGMARLKEQQDSRFKPVAWLKRTLGLQDEPQINTELSAVDDYVVVKKKDLDALVGELADLRSMNLSTDARELDLLLGNMEAENKKLKMDLEVLTMALRDATMNGRQ
jgi:hypothetical protein